MRQYGAVLGFPFGVEGLFFFLEAIFTAIYLYGWRRLPGWAHFWTGVPIAVSGIFGAMSVIAVNSWMNQPGGFTASGGRITSVDPGGWIQLVNCGHPPALRLSTDGELSPLAPATFTAPTGWQTCWSGPISPLGGEA